jgi:hypothetical protein
MWMLEVITSWKSSLADRPGKESVPISDPNSNNNQESVRVIKANPESIMEVYKPASVPSQTDDRVSEPEANTRMKANLKSRVSEPEATMSIDANPKFRVSEPEASMSFDANP